MIKTRSAEEMIDFFEVLLALTVIPTVGSLLIMIILTIVIPYIFKKMLYFFCFVIPASQVFLTIILSYIVRKLPDSEKQGENNEKT
jgi:flagellar biogenesis protein FliO